MRKFTSSHRLYGTWRDEVVVSSCRHTALTYSPMKQILLAGLVAGLVLTWSVPAANASCAATPIQTHIDRATSVARGTVTAVSVTGTATISVSRYLRGHDFGPWITIGHSGKGWVSTDVVWKADQEYALFLRRSGWGVTTNACDGSGLWEDVGPKLRFLGQGVVPNPVDYTWPFISLGFLALSLSLWKMMRLTPVTPKTPTI